MATTRIALRTTDTPVHYWTRPVRYDAWGDPYVPSFFLDVFAPLGVGEMALKPGGRTSRSWVEWKHLSGPPVRFENRNDRGWSPSSKG